MILMISACNLQKNVAGKYVSTCQLYDQPQLVLTMNRDSGFTYRLAYGEL